MKKYVKEFMFRGLICGGFGPIVVGIVYFIISLTINNFSLNGLEILVAIISSYILAFIQAGATVFEQIESFSPVKSLLFHMVSVYITYIFVYLVNSWIPFDLTVIIIFTFIFITLFLLIWFIVYFINRNLTKKLNEKIKA